VIFTHYRGDRHQDHRLVSDLTWNTFRDHLILEYEIPKYDGDLGAPNCYVPLDDAACREKTSHVLDVFATQRERPLVHGGHLPGPDAAARRRMRCPRRVRGGLLRAQARLGSGSGRRRGMIMRQAACPRVSIGVPVYNGARYLPELLDSLLAQTSGISR